MNRLTRTFLHATLLPAILGLSACGGDDLVGSPSSNNPTDTGGSDTTGDIVPPTYTNVTLNSHIPERVPTLENPDITYEALVMEQLFITGNPTSDFLYVLSDVSFDRVHVYRAEDIEQTMLDESEYPLNTMAVSVDNDIMVHIKQGMRVIDIASGDTNQIGTSGALFQASIDNLTITDDGGRVAFIVDSDLTTENPDNYYQIYTLSTDGNDVFTQISSFDADYFSSTTVSTVHALSGDGNQVFFHSDADILGDGSNADGSDEIFSISIDGSTIKQLTSLDLASTIIEIETDSGGNNVAFLTSDSELYSVDTATENAVLIDTLGKTIDIIIGSSIAQFDIAASGNVIYYATRSVPAEYPTMHEKVIYAVNPDGTNKNQVFTTGPVSYGSDIMSPQPSADGSKVSFLSSFDFGLTVAGENKTQVYTMTP